MTLQEEVQKVIDDNGGSIVAASDAIFLHDKTVPDRIVLFIIQVGLSEIVADDWSIAKNK